MVKTKICGRCKHHKSLDEFYFKNKARGTRQSYCRTCFSERHKDYYRDNKAYYITKKNQLRAKLKADVRKLKERPCTDCGLSFPYYVMDFDHRDASVKTGCIARIVVNGQRAKVLAEVAKCDLVCANCHRIRTHERSGGVLEPAP